MLKISDYKRWCQYLNVDFYQSMKPLFEQYPHDKNCNRIFFDLKVDPNRWSIKIPSELSDYLYWYGYPIINYNAGICRDKDGRYIRIGKLLLRLGREDLLLTYSNSKQNTLKNIFNLKVVISRHPYDIIGMSTNRGWSSCLDLNDQRYQGKYVYSLIRLLGDGSLVAYLIRGNDLNIRNPICRSLIMNWNKFYVDDHVYGTSVPEFREFLDQFTIEANQFISQKSLGILSSAISSKSS